MSPLTQCLQWFSVECAVSCVHECNKRQRRPQHRPSASELKGYLKNTFGNENEGAEPLCDDASLLLKISEMHH